MSRFATLSEFAWQTPRVAPGGLFLRADASVRTFGTFPPALGLTDASGFGSGQKAVRSTWAEAVAATARAIAATRHVSTADRPSMAGQSRYEGRLHAPLPVAPIRVYAWHGALRGRRRLGGRAPGRAPHARSGEARVLAHAAPPGGHRGGLRGRGDRARGGTAVALVARENPLPRVKVRA